jgi:conjugative relaxase-like TrwC/TraI family protein
MALRPTVLRNADQAVAYYGAELGTSEYYLKQKGRWHGKLAERLGLSPEVSREDFVALVNNQRPNGERLTARTNGTRRKTTWKLDEQSQSRVQVESEVSNRRVATDWTFSLEKDKSVYLAKTKDHLFESLVHQALTERLKAMEAEVHTRVRIGGALENRVTGQALFGVFIHRTTRPVDGVPDPHFHAHCVMPNVTFDEIEQRFKAAELGDLFANKAYHEEVFHARLNELAIRAGYGFRRTAEGLEMTALSREETRIFCKRTKEIEALEQKQRLDLNRKAAAIVTAAAKKGQLLEHESEYKKLKDKLGERSRQGKDTTTVDGPALEAEWGKQLQPGRWEAITPEVARNGQRIDFLDAESAKTMAIAHAFEKRSVIRDVDLFKSIALFGAGTMNTANMERFCREDPRLVRNPEKPGFVTTVEIVAEEQAIRDVAADTKGKYGSLAKDQPWEVRDKALDAGQLAAVKLVLENRDLAVCVPGYTGAGKSRTVKEAAHAVKAITGQDVIVLAPTGRAANALATDAGSSAAYTIAYFRTSTRLQEEARGRQIFCDEFSLVGNADGKWLLDFARRNDCRLTFWGDGAQHRGVSRGDPVTDLLKAGVIQYAQLIQIYRQQSNPDLLAAVQDAAENRYQESFEKVKEAGWIQTADNEQELRAALVDAMVEKYKRAEPVLAIALMHRHGEAIARDVRAMLKEEGLLGKEDHQVKWLREIQLTDAQRSDAVNFQPGQCAKFHRRSAGGFKSGEAWTVERVENERVIVSHNGQEKQLPLADSTAFQVFESGVMPIAAGDKILITKNNPKASIKTGDLARVKAIDDSYLTLENGRKLDISEGLHLRQGYSVTSHGSQGHQAITCFPFLPASAAGMMNQRQWLVDISRAKEELRVFTDCPELLEQCVVRPEERASALSLVKGSSKVPDIIRDLQHAKKGRQQQHEIPQPGHEQDRGMEMER